MKKRKSGPAPKTKAELKASGSWRGKLKKRALPPPAVARPKIKAPSAKVIEGYCRDAALLAGYDAFRDCDGFAFDARHARDEIQWELDHLTHVKGEKGGEPFILEPWQIAFWANLLSWFQVDGEPIQCRICGRSHPPRRYRTFSLFVPEGQGKTPMAAGLLVRLGEDVEPGAELYSAAFTREQAGLLWVWAFGMVSADEYLTEQWQVFHASHSMVRRSDGVSSLKSVASEARSSEGVNPSGVILDELHTFPQSKGETVRIFKSKSRKRRQPLMGELSTAGVERGGVCFQRWELGRKVRDGKKSMPTHLPVIYEVGPDDDWTKEEVWRKANPNWGVSVRARDFRELFEEAKADPYEENSFRRLKLNQWTEQAVRYFPMLDYDACPGTPVKDSDFEKLPIFAGFDGSLKDDLTALSVLWKEAGGVIAAKVRFWMPAEAIQEKEKRDDLPYRKWVDEGWITLTRGKVIDFSAVEEPLRQLKAYGLKQLNCDPAFMANWGAAAEPRLGIEFVMVPQTPAKLNEPTQTLHRLILDRKFRHGGNPVLRQHFANAEAIVTRQGLVQIQKAKAHLRVDGVVSIIVALQDAMSAPEPKKRIGAFVL